jgi:hypothetical protein
MGYTFILAEAKELGITEEEIREFLQINKSEILGK